VSAWVDGQAIEPRPGESILAAAARLGIAIPTLCYVPGLAPDGGCRRCVVAVEGHADLAAACHTPLTDGMRVTTAGPLLDALRARLDAFQRAAPPTAPCDASHAYLVFDPALCIACRRCVQACDEIPGRGVWRVRGPREAPRIACDGATGSLRDSSCVACGACVDVCPTSAITDRDRRDAPAPEHSVRTTCGYCGVGCLLDVGVAGGRVVRISGAPNAAANHGATCAKGRYAHAWQRSPERLTQPLLRRGGALVPVSWSEAIGWVAERLAAIHREHGPGALGVMTSSRSTNEAAYLLQKLFRVRFGTNHVDCCARVCHASTALALAQATGTGAASASYADIECARGLVVAGANPTEAHPVVGARLLRAARAGTPLLVLDPRRTEIAAAATLHLALRPGTNVLVLNALAKGLVERGAADLAYLEERCEGFETLAAFLAEQSIDEAARASGVSRAQLEAAADLLTACGPALFVTGLGLSELTQGVGSVRALANLALLSGAVGRPGAGLLPLRGQNNVQGNADMGSQPGQLTGYQGVTDASAREHFAALWGAEPPAQPGFTIPEMLAAARAGELRALWVQGEDLAQSDPDETRVLEALERLELLVVQELFMTETARRAHLVLPAAGFLEQDGTFTSGERRIQRVRAAVPAPGEARPDWEVARDVGRALGLAWDYASPGDVLDEIARAAPALFGGVSLARLGDDGVQWPCPDAGHPGTGLLHADGFLRGRAQLAVVRFAESPEAEAPGFPLALITGRVRQHYNVGTMTRRTPQRVLAEGDALRLHPRDAAGCGLADGDTARIESRHGATVARVALDDGVLPGTAFLSFHFPETHANRVVGPAHDPESKCPEYKLTAVRIALARRAPQRLAGGG
jgi:formate dehydrogenase major subunit